MAEPAPPARRPHVVLLRDAGADDRYAQVLREAGFRVSAQPVLSFSWTNRAVLRAALQAPGRYAGLICTSPRSAAAIREAGVALGLWRTHAIWAVGPATAQGLREAGLYAAGAEAGSAEALADLIAARQWARPLLFLAGSRRRDVLPDRLAEAGIAFEELTVYHTHVCTALDLPALEPIDWLVLYSPSGCEALAEAAGWQPASVRLATIGPTTAEAARRRGWAVDAVAEAPTPEALAAVLTRAS